MPRKLQTKVGAAISARVLAEKYGMATNSFPSFTVTACGLLADRLCAQGLLTVPLRQIDLGDLGRVRPFCPDYGFSRGTPIDRYYLHQFTSQTKDEVVGETLEIGGQKENQRRYGFTRAASYRVRDLFRCSGIDIRADAHDPAALNESSLDSVVMFNILEHCGRPWVVVENVRRWLRVGGKVFCLVPNAQRIHRDPRDYWRILPDAMTLLFESYRVIRIGSFGNLLACAASLSGMAAEDLHQKDLEETDMQYPVVTWIVAEKT